MDNPFKMWYLLATAHYTLGKNICAAMRLQSHYVLET